MELDRRQRRSHHGDHRHPRRVRRHHPIQRRQTHAPRLRRRQPAHRRPDQVHQPALERPEQIDQPALRRREQIASTTRTNRSTSASTTRTNRSTSVSTTRTNRSTSASTPKTDASRTSLKMSLNSANSATASPATKHESTPSPSNCRPPTHPRPRIESGAGSDPVHDPILNLRLGNVGRISRRRHPTSAPSPPTPPRALADSAAAVIRPGHHPSRNTRAS